MTSALLLLVAFAAPPSSSPSFDQTPREEDYWRIETVAAPDSVVLEVGGILPIDDAHVMVCTRRGELWTITNPWSEKPTFTLSLDGLQEPLGLLAPDGVGKGKPIYVAQRGELSRMFDDDGDWRIDRVETACAGWGISGNYHEYCFGPARDADGDLWVTLNRPFGGEPFGPQDWRGWGVRITPDGKAHFDVAGLRSPCGVGASPDGEIFYSDNQGEWCPTNKFAVLKRGEFHGHPHGIESAKRAESNVEFPGPIPDGVLMPEAVRKIPHLRLPAVWFPYDKMGQSASGFEWDRSNGKFGPFAGQIFIGDQHHSSVMRTWLEKVDGEWQGACFPFRSGFQCGIVRVAFLPDGSLAVGETNRGWGSRGTKEWGLERCVWSGVVPFEVLSMSARPDGFRLTFTEPVDPASAGNPASYRMTSYTYELHERYGSDEMDTKPLRIAKAIVSDDKKSVDLVVDGLREAYVHELHANGVRSADGKPLLHPEAYYTLNRIPK
ncbi:MAG: hypothetical protein U0572_07265 [Phycisphaerales bacterium]